MIEAHVIRPTQAQHYSDDTLQVLMPGRYLVEDFDPTADDTWVRDGEDEYLVSNNYLTVVNPVHGPSILIVG